jgi:hypothetical protein
MRLWGLKTIYEVIALISVQTPYLGKSWSCDHWNGNKKSLYGKESRIISSMSVYGVVLVKLGTSVGYSTVFIVRATYNLIS